jgi:tetratricopeptide (TPR) repeat protein
MTSEVFILGQIGKAVFQQDDRYYLLDADLHSEPIECRAGEVSLLFDSGSEVSVIATDEIDVSAIRDTLDFDTRAYRALSMTLGGLDNELTPESRLLSVEAAEELLHDHAVRAFVWKRLVARLLPVTADIQGAVTCAESAGAFLASSIYREILTSQPAIEVRLDAWKEVSPDFFDTIEESTAGEQALIESGVFAEEVAALTSNDLSRLNSVVVRYGTNRDLVRVIPRTTHLLNSVRKILIGKLETVAKTISDRDQRRLYSDLARADNEFDVTRTKSVVSNSISQLIEEFDKRSRDWRPSRAHEVEERIKNQITAVGKLIVKGDLTRANEFLYGLVKFHLEHSEKEHVAMSLCALAKIALDVRAFEMAKDLVGYAFSLELEDVVIWTTQAEILKAKAQPQAALTVYEEAMQRFPEDDVARNGYAEVLKEMGQLESARRVYEETVQRFPDSVVARNGYAEVLKALGQLEPARNIYEETMQGFPENVVAYNGYAEVLKEMGQLEPARKVYEETMQRFREDGVARNGYAELLKYLGHLEPALAVYDETIQRFPKNAFARNGYAEVLKDLGRLEPALTVYEETMQRFPENVFAPCGYAEVLKDLGRLEPALKVYEETMLRFPNNLVARRGCSSLLVVMDRFSEAASLLSYLAEAKPISRDYWRGSHILAMSYLKQGRVDEAIVRLEEGWRGAQWVDDRNYFRTALAVARIKKKEFAKALEVLSDNVIYLDVFQKQKRLALVAHTQAELGQVDAASDALEEIKNPGNRHIATLKIALTSRYNLNPALSDKLPEAEIARLEKKIYEEEIFLEMAA